MSQTDRNMELAIRLAEAGLYVFPCAHDKKPVVMWRAASTNDPDQVRLLWERFPYSLPAIDLKKSGLLAMDGDRHGGPDGVLALELLFSAHDFDPSRLPGSRTPGNGVHVYFRQNGSAIRNERGDLPGGIDVRGEGGYVIAPGAILSDGRQYEPMMGSPDLLEAYATQAIPYVPQWLVDILRPVRAEPAAMPPREATRPPGNREEGYARAAMDQISVELAACPGGARNESLNKAAFRLGTMVARGWIERPYVEDRLADAARACGLLRDDGPGQVVKTIKSGLGAGLREPHAELEDRPRERIAPSSDPEEPNPKAPPSARRERPATKRPVRLVSASELQKMRFEPIKYVVPGYVAEGLSILAGKPKIGKSWLCMDCALAVATGGVALGNIDCEQGDVLYLALEDNRRRLQKRLEQMVPGSAWPDRLMIASLEERWPTLDQGGVLEIAKWCDGVAMPRLVIIDTLAKVRGSKKDEDSAYDSDHRAVNELHALAGQRGIAVVLVHHVRKLEAEDPVDTVSGTTGLTGAADTILVLKRDGDGKVTLYGRGRDVEEIETSLSFDKTAGRWTNLGDAVTTRRSDSRQAIIDALEEGAETVGDMVAATGLDRNTVDQLLWKMARSGEVQKVGRGRYLIGLTVNKNPLRR